MARDLGDFQTPIELCEQIVKLFEAREFSRVLEPTCGAGRFLAVAGRRWPEAQRVGIEIQESYLPEARRTGAEIIHASLFDINLASDVAWADTGEILVIGNPPWVTNSELGSLGSINLPEKSNIKGLKGLDALTGAANFDITEFMIIKMIIELMPDTPTVAMLCKTQVARNVFEYCCKSQIPAHDFEIFSIDARRWFNASVDACLFSFNLGQPLEKHCAARTDLSRDALPLMLGYTDNGQLVTDLVAYESVRALDGESPLEWRQGLKHDASSVMELSLVDGKPQTKSGAEVDVEEEFIFPLLKSTDLHRDRLALKRAVVVPQRFFGEKTSRLSNDAPRLWKYLEANGDALDRRKSSIYRGKPRFSVFGLGPYSFAPWKVAVSGLHNNPKFRLIGPESGRPVFFDDTCYLLPFEDPVDAAIAQAILTSAGVQRFLESVKFPGAKRPVTKKLLQRIDLAKAAEIADPIDLVNRAQIQLGDLASVNASDLERFVRSISEPQGVLAI